MTAEEQVPKATVNSISTNDDGMGICVWVDFTGTGEGSKALLDTGAGISILPRRIFDAVNRQRYVRLRASDKKVRGANSKSIECFGMAWVEVEIEKERFKHRFYVCQDNVNVLLGRDFMKKAKISLEPAKIK